MFAESEELTAAVIVASRHRDEWRDVYDRLLRGEAFYTPEGLNDRARASAVLEDA